jgi:hypothetical protein
MSAEDDKFLKFLESAANGSINLQDLHTFSIEPRQRSDACKAALTYVLNLRSKAMMLLQQLRLSQFTSSQQNEMQQENARLKAKLKLLDSVKKDELIKRLEAKEQECLEYRARLDRIKPPSSDEDPDALTPVAVLEAEVERRMETLRVDMELSRSRIAGLMQEMQLVKTTARERINVLANVEYSEADEQSRLPLLTETPQVVPPE